MVFGSSISGLNIKDKGIKFWRKFQRRNIKFNFQNSKFRIAVKDGSKLKLTNYEF